MRQNDPARLLDALTALESSSREVWLLYVETLNELREARGHKPLTVEEAALGFETGRMLNAALDEAGRVIGDFGRPIPRDQRLEVDR